MKRIRLSSILFLSSILGFGQDLYRFRHLMTSDGLPNNSISALFVDSHGLLWIGTESGLAWYDGYEVSSITQYDDGNGQTALGAVNGIMEDTTGNLLLNVGGRQMVYDRHSHTVSSMKEEGRKSFIDLHGQQWNIEVCSLSADDFHKKIAVPAGTFSSSSHIGLYRDKTESFWLYSFDDETLLRSSDGKIWQSLHLPNNNTNGNNAIRCLADNDHGMVFIATDHQGLFCYQRTDGTVTQIQRTGNNPWEIASNNVSQVLVHEIAVALVMRTRETPVFIEVPGTDLLVGDLLRLDGLDHLLVHIHRRGARGETQHDLGVGLDRGCDHLGGLAARLFLRLADYDFHFVFLQLVVDSW